MIVPLALLVGGLVVLLLGAEAIVRGASRLALALGLSRLVVGLVIVALGTSAPEAAVTVGATLEGRPELALGNAVGSNTFNVLFILGLAALAAPLAVSRRVVRFDVPVMLGASLLLAGLAFDGRLTRQEGGFLLLLAVVYVWSNVAIGRRDGPGAAPPVSTTGGIPLAVLATAGGALLLVVGAHLAVVGATEIARSLGVSDLVIGLTVVAAGTGLPEVATSVLAAVRGERDIAIGNVVGSCVLNVVLVLGLASTLAGGGLDVAIGVRTFDLPVMVGAAAAVLPTAFTRQIVARWEGLLFLLYYVAYVTFLVLNARVHPATASLSFAIVWFVLPLTLVVLGASVVRELRRRAAKRS